MKLIDQGRDEIKKFKERRIALLGKIEDKLKKLELDWRAKTDRDVNIYIKYPKPESCDEIRPRLTSIRIDCASGENSSFYFQFAANDNYGPVSLRAIKENLKTFSEQELEELLASFDLDEEREMSVKEMR